MKITFGLDARHKDALTALVQSHTLLPEYQALMADLAGAINAAWGHPPVPPPSGRVYAAWELSADDWVYYVQTPAVEWRVENGADKSRHINSYQTGGSNYPYFLDNFQRVRDTYAGILVQ